VRVLLPITIAAVALYALLCAAAWIFQDRLVWYPGPPPRRTPADEGLAFDDVVLAARDGARVHAWHVRAGSARGVVVVCQGNAGSIEDRLPLAQAFQRFGYDVLLFDYRAYGGSTGALSEEGTYLDGEAALDHAAASGFGPERTVLYGESLGGAVAIELARRRAVAALVVEDTFTSLPDIGAQVYPWLPVRLLARVRYDSIAKVPGLRAPFLVLHSPEDTLVPFAHAERLFAAHPGPKRMLATAGHHNSGGFLQRPEWRADVRRFLDEHMPAR
jgi:hypothetical protein